MIQSFDTQLQVVMQALSDVLAPALAAADKHVVEQLNLSLATLSFIKSRLPEARRYYRMELSSYLALAEEAVGIAGPHLGSECGAIREQISSGRVQLNSPEADVADYQAVTRRLREGIAALLNRADGQDDDKKLNALILDKSERILNQYRLWCLPFGFESNIEHLGQDW